MLFSFLRSLQLFMALLMLGTSLSAHAQDVSKAESDAIFAEVLRSTPTLRGLAAEPERYRMQILFAEILPEENGKISLKRYAYRENAEYFYPASTVKIAAAASAIQVLEALQKEHTWISVDTPMRIHPLFEDEQLDTVDESNVEGGLITIRNEIRKTLIVSDNQAFNRLYELVGQDQLDTHMRAAGLSGPVIVHRLAEGRTALQNRQFPRIDFHQDDQHQLTIPARTSERSIDTSWLVALPGWPDLDLGRAVYFSPERTTQGPMKMAGKNAIKLRDLQNLTAMIVRPEIDLGLPGLDVTSEHRKLLIDAMTDLPSQSRNPHFDPEEFTDDYPHFFRQGIGRVVPLDSIGIANKIGLAYGFSTETAYIEHVPSGRAFFLAMTIYTNDNAILNDGVYEYDLATRAMQDVAHAFAARVFAGISSVDSDPQAVAHPNEHHLRPASTIWKHDTRELLSHDSPFTLSATGDTWLSEPVESSLGYLEVIASWNASVPDDTRVRFEVRSRHQADTPWSEWLAIGQAGSEIDPSPWTTRSESSGASVDVDTLIMPQPTRWLQVRAIRTDSNASAQPPALYRVDVCMTSRLSDAPQVADERFAGQVEVPTPFYPNNIDDPALNSRLCSPLSLRMLLGQRGKTLSTRQVADAVYDARFDIYGNWSNAIQAAFEFGVPGKLIRFSDWSSVRQHLASVGPLAISIRAAEGELTNAPYTSTEGHLIVLYGLDSNGDAMVLDPAVTDPVEARRIYKRDELTAIWLDRVKGLAYALLPQEAHP
jgi:hypothetical protein